MSYIIWIKTDKSHVDIDIKYLSIYITVVFLSETVHHVIYIL